MGTFALNIGYALIGIAAVVAVWIVWMKRRAPKPRPWLGLPRELEALRTDFEELIDGALAEAQRATKIGETFVAALKPIDQAIRDFKNRITELEKRSDAGDKRSSELEKRSDAVEKCSGELEKRADGGDKRLEELERRADAGEKRSSELEKSVADLEQRIISKLEGINRQLTAMAEQLSNVKVTLDSSMAAHEQTGDDLRTITGTLAAVQTHATGLSQRSDAAEANHARLSTSAESLAQSVAAIDAFSKETAQRISTLEPRVLWKIEELAMRLDSTLAALNPPPAGDAPDQDRSFHVVSQPVSHDDERHGYRQPDSTALTADAQMGNT